MSLDVRHLCKLIGKFYHIEHREDAVYRIHLLGITKVEPYSKDPENTLAIHLYRAGLLIGRGGKNISSLSNFLGCKIAVIEETSQPQWLTDIHEGIYEGEYESELDYLATLDCDPIVDNWGGDE